MPRGPRCRPQNGPGRARGDLDAAPSHPFCYRAVLPKATQLGFTAPPALRKSASKPAATRFEVTSLEAIDPSALLSPLSHSSPSSRYLPH